MRIQTTSIPEVSFIITTATFVLPTTILSGINEDVLIVILNNSGPSKIVSLCKTTPNDMVFILAGTVVLHGPQS